VSRTKVLTAIGSDFTQNGLRALGLPRSTGAVESGASFGCEDTVKPTSDQPAQRFDHYELVTGEDGKAVELGRGAMGVTYKAFDIELRLPETLKVISEKYVGDESARLRFLREARAAAKVRHTTLGWRRGGRSCYRICDFYPWGLCWNSGICQSGAVRGSRSRYPL
jgi:hypothetical protein